MPVKHKEAIEEHLAERYLLGEMSADDAERFEQSLFRVCGLRVGRGRRAGPASQWPGSGTEHAAEFRNSRSQAFTMDIVACIG